jgi:hypothetical protein
MWMGPIGRRTDADIHGPLPGNFNSQAARNGCGPRGFCRNPHAKVLHNLDPAVLRHKQRVRLDVDAGSKPDPTRHRQPGEPTVRRRRNNTHVTPTQQESGSCGSDSGRSRASTTQLRHSSGSWALVSGGPFASAWMGVKPMWARRMLMPVLSASFLLSVGIAVSSASATPGEPRPRGVADVKDAQLVLLHADGTVTVAARVRCDPEWVPAELSAILAQGETSISGYTIPSVPCDTRWHLVEFNLVDGSGALHPGKATFSLLQFLVTNAVTGDSAGAHDNGAPVRLQLAG